MASDNQRMLTNILNRAGLATLVANFDKEKVDPAQIERLSDEELSRLGVGTIGERIRLRESAKQEVVDNTDSLTTRVFPGFRNLCRQQNTKKKTPKVASWTAQFLCLSSTEQVRTPNCSEKEILHKSGLGLKKMKLLNTHKEEEVLQLLQNIDAFRKLKVSGGFELLRTQQNCRNLVPIPGPWTSQSLKINVGPQARIYIRPIQHSLSLDPLINEENEPSVKVACDKCKVEIPLQDLRDHVRQCGFGVSDSDLPDLNWPSEETQHSLHLNSNEISLQDSIEENMQVSTQGLEHMQVSTQGLENMQVSTQGLENMQVSTQGLLEYSHNAVQNQESVDGLDIMTDQSFVTGQHGAIFNSTEQGVKQDVQDIVMEVIHYCQGSMISNPVEILKSIQKALHKGRKLDIADPTNTIEGETNFIIVDRSNILETSFEEIAAIPEDDLRTTIEVQFYDEVAVDYGGPRKEFFQLVLTAIKQKYFDACLKEHLSEDYVTVGKIFSLSMLQNGKIPRFVEESVLMRIFSSNELESPCIINLRQGLNSLGIYTVGIHLPLFLHLLRPTNVTLTYKAVTTLLRPKFTEEGSNSRQFENQVYAAFLKYLRSAASGRRGSVSLGHILQFATSTNEEPVLGFSIQPSIEFVESSSSFLPTANTCINCMKLPRPSLQVQLPDEESLFSLYDYAFMNNFYGLL